MTIRSTPLPPLTFWGAMRWDLVRTLLPSRLGGVVEYGCGQGSFGARLAARSAAYVGIEPAAASADVARSRVTPFGGTVVPRWEDPANPVTPADVELLCAFEVLEHIEDDERALQGWVAPLVPGTRVIVSVPAEPERFGPWDENVGHFRRYSSDGLTDLLASAGLVGARAAHYGYPFGYALEGARNAIARRRPVDDGVDMSSRTEGSGALRQPRATFGVDPRWCATAPFRAWQRAVPGRGPGLVGWARVPG